MLTRVRFSDRFLIGTAYAVGPPDRSRVSPPKYAGDRAAGFLCSLEGPLFTAVAGMLRGNAWITPTKKLKSLWSRGEVSPRRVFGIRSAAALAGESGGDFFAEVCDPLF